MSLGRFSVFSGLCPPGAPPPLRASARPSGCGRFSRPGQPPPPPPRFPPDNLPVAQACSPGAAAAMAAPQLFRALVSAQWVAEALRTPRAGPPLQLLDASWYLPKLGRDARREFEERHIPGAAFFDIDQCSDRTSPYDHMLPSAAHFAEYAGHLGVGADTHVVVYDASDQGLYAAPRVWWMFRAFGHRTVSLLDGGFRHWLRLGLPLSSGKSRPAPAEFRASLDAAFVKTYEDIKENLESRRFQVVDARAAGRFRGTEPEPRDGNNRARRGGGSPGARGPVRAEPCRVLACKGSRMGRGRETWFLVAFLALFLRRGQEFFLRLHPCLGRDYPNLIGNPG